MADGFNQARAMRVAEIINDYRTLLVHISQQQVEATQDEYYEEGFVVLRESLASAQTLMSANYQPCPVTGQGNAETEKAELQRVILDGSARRFQAHRIYLRAAAARRWAMTRHGGLKTATAALHQDLARITDQHVVADLRAADMRAGHWVDDDPSLEAIRRWIAGH
ncbi:hypothetical protein N7457_000225 [Penicillium paradoxum]|uniref:uncharacterized protein n=1 Tax=Penicillium paradoxum TaxID=176176 RepID=UPI002549A216|nr:uncharacterized protein N7457_000225 [Penicillium paradoxum]KAJ5793626.1 hypothetical protein N7457_000225 [Penicillium paradoxum]